MAIKFVKCRRVDDHSRTADIAESALQHLPQWEPIPEAELPREPEPERARGTQEAATGQGVEQPPELKTTTRKSRSKAASTDKE